LLQGLDFLSINFNKRFV